MVAKPNSNVSLRALLSSTKALTNFLWLMFDKIFRGGLALLVTAVVARYLGPDLFCQLNFLIVVNGVFVHASNLGIGPLLTALFLRLRSKDKIFTASLFLLLASSSVTVFVVNICVRTLDIFSAHEAYLLSVLSLLHLTAFSVIFRSWFEAELRSKLNVAADFTAILLASLLRIALVMTEAPIDAFIYAALAETLVASVMIVFLYYKYKSRPGLGAWDIRYFRSIFARTLPLAGAGIAVTGYMKVDQIMLGSLLEQDQLGYYTVALRFTEMLYFIPAAIAVSMTPYLMQGFQKSEIAGNDVNQIMHDLAFVVCLICVVPIVVFAEPLVGFIFGKEYLNSVPILRIYALSSFSVFFGVVSGRWLIARSLEKVILIKTVIGLIMNLILNLLWIPKYGVMGAAYATLVSQTFVNVVYDVLDPRLAELFSAKLKSLNIIRISLFIFIFLRNLLSVPGTK